MSQKSKLLERFLLKPKDFSWDELVRLLISLGFDELSHGKTGGSRRKYYNKEKELIINLHKPHPGAIVKIYVIEQVIAKLEEEG